MTSSESPEPETPDTNGRETSAEEEAQRAADGLRQQIAAVRDRVRQARDTLAEQARREQERRTFKR